jgi:glycosyltransferase involved in cell wall biosynthesis
MADDLSMTASQAIPTQELPVVTIITTCYNEKRHLPHYIRGVLSQTYPHLQLIFVDDGSIDGSGDLMLQYQSALEEKCQFVFLRQANTGYVTAINNALEHVRGDYICFFDADDMMLPHKIESHVDYLHAHRECGLVYSDGLMVRTMDGGRGRRFLSHYREPPSGWVYDKIYENDFIMSGTYCFRRECLAIVSPLEQRFDNRGQNIQVLAGVTRHYPVGFHDVGPVMKYRVRPDSMSRRKTLGNERWHAFVRRDLHFYLLDRYGSPDGLLQRLARTYRARAMRYAFLTLDRHGVDEAFSQLSGSSLPVRERLRTLGMFLLSRSPWCWRSYIRFRYPGLNAEVKSANTARRDMTRS